MQRAKRLAAAARSAAEGDGSLDAYDPSDREIALPTIQAALAAASTAGAAASALQVVRVLTAAGVSTAQDDAAALNAGVVPAILAIDRHTDAARYARNSEDRTLAHAAATNTSIRVRVAAQGCYKVAEDLQARLRSFRPTHA